MEALKVPQPLISAEEQRQRIEAVAEANASVQLEGLKITPETQQRQKQFVDGEISLQQLING